MTELFINVSKIIFTHVPTGLSVELPCYLKEYSDDFQNTWTEETVYGRMDAIQTYQNTTRRLSVGFSVPASTIHEAKYFLGQLDQLIRFQYPVYSDPPHNSLRAAPLIRVRFDNFIMNGVDTKGLLIALQGVTYRPNIDEGMFNEAGTWYPKSFDVSLAGSVIHEHSLGWNSKGEWRGKDRGKFPHNSKLTASPSTLKPGSESKNEAATQVVLGGQGASANAGTGDPIGSEGGG